MVVVVVVGSGGGCGGPRHDGGRRPVPCQIMVVEEKKNFSGRTFASAVLGGAGIKTTSYENKSVHSFS